MKIENIISEIAKELKMSVGAKHGDSFYKQSEVGRGSVVVIRVSNHRTHLETWRIYPTKKGFASKSEISANGGKLPYKYKTKYMYSFVFEDTPTENDLYVKGWPLYNVREAIYKPSKITKAKLSKIIDALRELLQKNYYDETVLGKPAMLYPIIKN